MPESDIRILFVDDDHITLTLLVSMARRDGYQNVDTAKSGREALKKFLVFKPDIVFLDIEMPELDGIGTLRAIKQFGFPTQVVMVSATLTADRLSAAKEEGAAGFIVKPASPKRLADAIESCLKLNSQQAGKNELFVVP